jgi:predicted ATPase
MACPTSTQRRFIITGAPGAGKTAIVRQLELDGFGVVEEAATNSGGIHRLSMQSAGCKGIVRFKRPSSRMRFSFTTVGFVTATEARRITFEETVRFEKVHEEIYRDFGFELIPVEPGNLLERVSIIKAAISIA